MATYNGYTNEFSAGSAVHQTTVDGVTTETRSNPGQNNTVRGPSGGVKVGGIELSPDQADALGMIPKREGQTPIQALRTNEIHQAAYAAEHAKQTREGTLEENGNGEQPKTVDRTRQAHNARIANDMRRDFGLPERTAEEQANAQVGNFTLESFDADGAKAVVQFNNHVSEGDLNVLLDNALDGAEISDARMSEMVFKYGLTDPSQIQENMFEAQNALRSQFDAYVASKGIDSDELGEWIKENYSEHFGRLARDHFRTSNPTSWNEAINAYTVSQSQSDPATVVNAIKAAGMDAFVSGKEVIITIDGTQMRYSDALKNGLITASYS